MYQPIILPYFYKQLKRYGKKYRHLKEAVINALEHFNKRTASSLGGNVYKIRLRTKDIPRGKSKSFRLLILIIEEEYYLVPITIYFKGEHESINRKEINDHLGVILFELRSRELLPLPSSI